MTSFNPNSLTTVGFIDPAGSKNQHLKKQRSSQAIVIVGGDVLGRAFVLEAWHDRVSIDKFVDKIGEIGQRYPAMKSFGCESNAMQELFAGTTEIILKSRGIRLPLRAVPQSNRIDKDMRIRMVLQPMLAFGKLFIQKSHDELRKAILTFPQTELRLKDIIDCLASAIHALPNKPMQKARDQTLEGLATYLKRANVPPAVAQGRLEAFARAAGRGRGA